jgi:F-type H+-transporting ATPase subunit a
VSLYVLGAPLVSVAVAVPSDSGGSFVPPSPANFWQPLIGGDSSWALTRPAVVCLLSVGLLAWFFVASTRQLSIVPGKRQFRAELAYDFVRNTIARDVIGSKDFLPFVPLLLTMFSMILVNNLFGVLPFVQFPTFSRIAFPIVLTLIVFVVYHVVGIRRKGGFVPWLKSMVPQGLPGWIVPLMFVLELLTYFVTRPVTLALRLFGNMFAGHLLLLVFTLGGEYLLLHGSSPLKGAGILSFLFTIVMTFFELLVEFLQAFIFTMLAALYIAGAVADEH